MRKLLTGEPYAGKLPVRFGGRGDHIFPTPINEVRIPSGSNRSGFTEVRHNAVMKNQKLEASGDAFPAGLLPEQVSGDCKNLQMIVVIKTKENDLFKWCASGEDLNTHERDCLYIQSKNEDRLNAQLRDWNPSKV